MIPANAKPDGNRKLFTINPADKKKRNKTLSPKEQLEFGGICTLGAFQILDCYEWLSKDVCKEEFEVRCFDCPYAHTHDLTVAEHRSNRFPYFLDEEKFGIVEGKGANNVYFVTDGEFVKIGVAKDVESRIEALQTSNARKISLLFAIPVADDESAFSLEAQLHQEYRSFRLEGEWFDILKYLSLKDWQSLYS